MDSAIRQKLHDAYMDLAEQAAIRRQWEAASAFQYAAGLALGLTVNVEDPPNSAWTCSCTGLPQISVGPTGKIRCVKCHGEVRSES